jgi:hypothetical protein
LRTLSFIFISALLIGPSFAADKVVQVTPGSKGDLDPSRLYVVKYNCGKEDSSDLWGYRRLLSGVLVNGSGVVNVSATINSKTADATPAASGSTVFTSNILTATYGMLNYVTAAPSCNGQFFINGLDNYSIVVEAGYTESTSVIDFLSSIATDAIDLTAAFHPLIRMTKPAELDNKINNTKTTLASLEKFRSLLTVPPAKGKDSGDLRVGVNWVRALDGAKSPIAWLRLDVQPITGFLQNKVYQRYLIAFGDAALKTPISLDGDNNALSGRCDKIRQTYRSSGINDIKDVAYLMYRPEKIVTCLRRETALAALDLLKQNMLDPIKEYRITRADIDNYAPETKKSDQPHSRVTLDVEMNAFASLLGTHLQGNGLRGTQLAKLLADFSPSVTLEDTTRDYKVLAALKVNDPNAVSMTAKSDDLLTKLKAAGIIRWGCVQRTKKDKPDPTFRIYDPEIDSAVMLIAAIAKPDEELDFNKTPMFGVHLLFEPAAPSDALHVKKIVFETDRRDIILRQNPTCAKNVPGAKAQPQG